MLSGQIFCTKLFIMFSLQVAMALYPYLMFSSYILPNVDISHYFLNLVSSKLVRLCSYTYISANLLITETLKITTIAYD